MKLSVAVLTLTAAVAVSFPHAVQAQPYATATTTTTTTPMTTTDFPEYGPYFRAGGGAAFTQGGYFRDFDGAPGGNFKYRTGLAVNAAGGYQFTRNFGMDVEVGWIVNEMDKAPGFTFHDTFVHNIPVLANLIVQLPIPNTGVTPYIGAGAGGSITIFDTDGFSNGTVSLHGSDSDVVFAHQFFGGVRFNVNPQISVGVEYKYFVAHDSKFRYPDFFGVEPDVTMNLSGVRSHLVTATVNVKF